jgi:hypothetical protein
MKLITKGFGTGLYRGDDGNEYTLQRFYERYRLIRTDTVDIAPLEVIITEDSGEQHNYCTVQPWEHTTTQYNPTHYLYNNPPDFYPNQPYQKIADGVNKGSIILSPKVL